MMVVDSDVIIWAQRGNAIAEQTLRDLKQFFISSITYLEVARGLDNKREIQLWKAFLREHDVELLMVDEEINTKAMYWMEDYGLSHKLGVADALIAATAENYGQELLTDNTKDYHFLPVVFVKKFKA